MIMNKRILIVALVLLFSFNYCFAFDGGSIIDWFNNDLRVFLEDKLGRDSRLEFEREVEEVIDNVPNFIRSVWEKLTQLLK